jgi:hypothetical protein
MKVYIRGSEVNLSDNNWLTGGGEGSIYELPGHHFPDGSRLIKIFTNKKNATPIKKIKELEVLNLPNIMRPLLPVLNKNKSPIGFLMKEVVPHHVLCQLYTSTFWKKHGVSLNKIIELIQNLEQTFKFIHSNKCLVVDANDFNFLVDKTDITSPYFIDVDSYKTPSFAPTAITDTIKDWQANNWTVNSDWFSFAILACQLLVGIHPFKGTHPKFPNRDIIKRMMANVSIFNKDTKVPMSTRNLDNIPNSYKDWFIQLFEMGQRHEPPDIFGVLNFTFKDAALTYGLDEKKLDIESIWSTTNDILSYTYRNEQDIVGTKEHFFIQDKTYFVRYSDAQVVSVGKRKIPVAIGTDKGYLKICRLDTLTDLPLNIKARAVMVVDNTPIVISGNKVLEVCLTELSDRVIASCGANQGAIIRYAQILNGTIYQNILGKPHFTFFVKDKGKLLQHIKYLPELEGYKVVDGKYENQVLSVMAYKDGQYAHFLYTFYDNFSAYGCHPRLDVDLNSINMTVLDSGLILQIIEEGILEVFKKSNISSNYSRIEDKNINLRMRLCHKKEDARFFDGQTLYSMSMKT